MLRVCPECLGKIKGLQVENEQLRQFLDIASKMLRENGFHVESESLDWVSREDKA
ncbi:MAG: hypothetical protein WC476_13385 [Phycisphaerae bacterium]|jgi:hypothetical protein